MQKESADLGIATVHLPGEDDTGNQERAFENTRLCFWDADRILQHALQIRLGIAIDIESSPSGPPIALRYVIRSASHGDVVMEPSGSPAGQMVVGVLVLERGTPSSAPSGGGQLDAAEVGRLRIVPMKSAVSGEQHEAEHQELQQRFAHRPSDHPGSS